MKLADWKAKRTLVYGSGSALAIALVLVILVFLALLAEQYPWRWDLTAEKSQSLTEVTRNLLAEVKEPLKMTAFYPEGENERRRARELLEVYHYRNHLVSYTFVDPERQPLVAKQAGYRYPGNVLLEYQERKQMAANATEDAITNAMRKLLHPEPKKLYFLTGHGERGLKDAKRGGFQTAKQALENEGFTVAELNLLTQTEVPADATVVVVAGPEKPLFPNEIEALKSYLDRGGHLLVLLEPFHDAGLKDFLAAYGIELDNRMILDVNQVSRALGASITMPLVITYGDHRITQDFTNVVTLYPLARPLHVKESPAGVHLFELAKTTDTSWAKAGQGWIKAGQVGFDESRDQRGPFTLAVLAEIRPSEPQPEKASPNPEPKAKSSEKGKEKEPVGYLAVFGDADFADNTYFNLSGNGDLFLNTVNFLAAEESQITVRRQEKKSQPLLLSGYQSWVLVLVTLVLLPLAMIAAGINAYFRRRRRR